MYRINDLLKLDRRLYHSNDLAILWGISNRNTLYTTIKRYVKSGVLIPVYKGLYSTVPLERIDQFELGQAIIHSKAYLSTESVLAKHGIISQQVYAHTFVSNRSKKVTVSGISFVYRKLQDIFLNNPIGIIERGNYFEASLERAVADMLYFNPKYYFDLSAGINWGKVSTLQRQVGYIK
ncbi:MAG: type IV toxin-antitoxin system AbiEi family antitoxin domain-containing protein [Candidatus Saccharimonadales bacterium]